MELHGNLTHRGLFYFTSNSRRDRTQKICDESTDWAPILCIRYSRVLTQILLESGKDRKLKFQYSPMRREILFFMGFNFSVFIFLKISHSRKQKRNKIINLILFRSDARTLSRVNIRREFFLWKMFSGHRVDFIAASLIEYCEISLWQNAEHKKPHTEFQSALLRYIYNIIKLRVHTSHRIA